MIMRLCLVPVTVIMILLQTTISVSSQNTAGYTHHFCLANGTANGNTFTAELNALLDNLSSKSASQSFFNDSSDTLSSLYLCRGDDTPDACRDCVATAIRDIRSRCPFGREAIIWYNECMVRYSNQSFLGILQYSPGVFMWNINNNTSPTEPDSWALSLVDRLVAEAPVSELKYRADVLAVADGMRTEQRYALVQCSRDISVDNCRVCLRRLTDEIQDCCQGKKGWRILTPSCNIRYEEYSFFGSSLAPSGPPPGNPTNSSKRKKSTSKIILAIVLPISAVVMVVFGFLFFRCNKRTEKEDDRGRSQVILMSNEYKDEDGMDLKDDEDDSAGDIHFFDISTIEAATNNFSAANKLGQGGFGPVYKGKLLNGKEIAVKRLSRNSGQGVGEFKTEVRLIVKLQHRNLVRLLGCCIERKEKLLIYEYLPNLSLDAFLFDATRSRELDWAKRANIIQGIAKGLLYLHEDSRLKIIHRDLKASNILLDADMNPKISDFGTARIVGGNQMEVSTQRIVGTYGYMAPEYAMEGIFSVKSDVYSFGVMLLEIVSGKKNSTSFGQMPHVQSLLSYAWKQWNSGKMEEFIDGAIVENGSIEEAVKWTNIALLCVQENPETRPTMSAVVMMLGNQWTSLPRPAEAPFFVRHFSTNEAHDSVSSPFSVRHIFQQSWSHEVDTVSVNSSHQTSTSASN